MSEAWLLAHGVGGRTDLPLPLWLFAYGAGGAVVISFAALGLLWPASRMERGVRGAPAGRVAGRALASLEPLARLAGLAFFVLVLAAAGFGDENPARNLAPLAVYVVFWVGLQAVVAVLGDVWRVLSPFDTLALAASWVNRRVLGREPRPRAAPAWGHWPAVVGIFAFVWMELAFHDSASPDALAVALAVYTVAVLAGAARWGRGWLREHEAFAVWFGLLARMAPFHRDDEGRLRVRPPLAGLPRIRVLPGTVALVLVVLGSTSFDGFTRTELWNELAGGRTGWELTLVSTLGLLWLVALVWAAYAGAMRVAAHVTERDPEDLVEGFVHSLVPIAFAYVVAHYFSLLVIEGQGVWALLSDPLGRGWDLFGTASWTIDFTIVSTSTVAWVQAAAIVLGHVAGVLVAHDRAVAWFDRSLVTRSQYPLLAVMVLYTVGGLGLLMGG